MHQLPAPPLNRLCFVPLPVVLLSRQAALARCWARSSGGLGSPMLERGHLFERVCHDNRGVRPIHGTMGSGERWRIHGEIATRRAAGAAACHEHFLDPCEPLGHPKLAADDPTGERFCFDRGAKKLGGEDGWADVWKKGLFGWEDKGKHKDLDAAYGQLLKYRESLQNPPLLVACDMDRMVGHANFTNTPCRVHEIPLEDLGTPRAHEILRPVSFEPEKLMAREELDAGVFAAYGWNPSLSDGQLVEALVALNIARAGGA